MKFSTFVVSLALAGSSASAFTVRPNRASTLRLSSTVASSPPEVEVAAAATPEAETPKPVNDVKAAMDVELPMTEEEEQPPMNEAANTLKPGRYSNNDKSIAIPFLKRPSKLDGSHAGDYGFDPLGFTEEFDLYYMQECEIRHARLAMLAVIGWPMSELVAPKFMLQGAHGCAPSVLNGFNPLTFVATVAVFAFYGWIEYLTALRRSGSTAMGLQHKADMAEIWNYGVAGDYNFDPMGWYSTLLGDTPVARKGMRELEISHGRSAMLGITAFALWEFLTGHPIVENSMFFHPNLLLPALALGYVAFNQVYEVELNVDDRYLFQIKQTSEGEARLENFKMNMANAASGSAGALEALAQVGEKAADLGEKAAKAAVEIKKKVDEKYQEE